MNSEGRGCGDPRWCHCTPAWVTTVKLRLKKKKTLEKRLDNMLTRITSVEKNINDLMELKNTAQELHEAYTRFNS